MSSTPETSVIVINMNGVQFLQTCFMALRRQTYKDFETMLVDNGSTDGSVKFMQENYPEVKILSLDHNYGFGVGNNEGIRKSRGKYVALLNNDTEVDPCWLSELVKGIKSDPGLAMCASKLVFADNPGIVDSAGDELFWFGQSFTYRYYPADHPAVTKQRRCFSACAGAALYRRDVLDEIGLFDEIYTPAFYEDIDIGFRSQLRGYEALYVPSAVVLHKVSATAKRNMDNYIFYNQRNAEYLLFINYPFLLLIRCLPFRFIYLTGNFIAHLIRGYGVSFLRGKIDFLRSFPKVLQKRSHVQRHSRLSTGELYKKLFKGWLRRKIGHITGKM